MSSSQGFTNSGKRQGRRRRLPGIEWRISGAGGWRVLAPLIAFIVGRGCAPSPVMYSYRAINEQCNCEEYWVLDKAHRVGYLFTARYRMENGVTTSIDVKFVNNSSDTLSLDRASVRVSSRNISYQYNDRFLPLPSLTVVPKRSDSIHLSGKEVSGKDDWNKIAGEQLTITLKGVRLGGTELPQQSVDFIPENPKMGTR